MALDVFLLQGPTGALFLMSEVPLSLRSLISTSFINLLCGANEREIGVAVFEFCTGLNHLGGGVVLSEARLAALMVFGQIKRTSKKLVCIFEDTLLV